MADLLSEFFKRDLTDAEEQRLADLLAASPQKSLRFADLAHKAYLRTGLPDAGGAAGGAGGAGGGVTLWGPTLMKVVLLAAAGGLGTYLYWSLAQKAPDLSKAAPSPGVESVSAPLSIQAAPKAPSATRPRGTAPRTLPALALPTFTKPGMVKPIAYDPSKKYEGLDIMVEQKSAGLLTVRTLDDSKTEVRLLFAGMLAPGKWSFQWDGKRESGEPAPPGSYLVEVQSGREVLTKEIVIRGESLAGQKP